MKSFVAKLAIMMHKVPHLVLFALFFLSLDGAQIAASWAGTPLAPYQAGLLKAVTYATMALAALKQFKPGPLADAVDAALKPSKSAQAGVIRLRAMLMVTALAGVILFLPAASGTCNSNTALATAPGDVNLGLCVAEIVEAGMAQTPPATWEQDVAAALAPAPNGCTGAVVQIINSLDDQVVGQAASGKLTLDQAQDALVRIHTAANLPPPAVLSLKNGRKHS